MKKRITYAQKIIKAVKELPNPLEDKRHSLWIYFLDEKARSNETRFSHIAHKRHELSASDVRRIPKHIKTCIFKKDKERAETYNIYIKRYNYDNREYIKLSLAIEDKNPHKAIVKTIFITKNIK